MPSYYDIPLTGLVNIPNFQVEDVNKFQKLPFYLVMNEVKRFPIYKTWDALFGSIKWQPNMGSIMRGVRPEYSPVGDSFVFPANITTTPNRNIFETLESIEEARVKLHRFESKQFHFLPSFQDFRDNQLKWNHDDIIRQIALYNERFLRGMAFFRSPNICIAGNNGSNATFGTTDLVQGVAVNDPATDATIPADGKTIGWRAAVGASVGQTLTLKELYKSCSFLDDDLGAPTFEGVNNMPRDNELIKGKYVLICGTDAWRQFTFDPDVASLKSIELNLLFDGFKGSLFGMITCKAEKYPLRFGDDGIFIAPQVIDQLTMKTRPNPLYTSLLSAKYEIAFLCGGDAWKSVAVGPPPKEFSSKSMDAEKFYSLKWNGEVQLTDQVLIKYSDGTLDLNRYGTQLQLISQGTFAALAGEVNNILPIIFRRTRVSTV